MTTNTRRRCECGNYADKQDSELCDVCDFAKSQPAHEGHWSLFGTYWCDTCNSPYCDLA